MANYKETVKYTVTQGEYGSISLTAVIDVFRNGNKIVTVTETETITRGDFDKVSKLAVSNEALSDLQPLLQAYWSPQAIAKWDQQEAEDPR